MTNTTQGNQMETIAQALREAYKLLRQAQTENNQDITEFFFAVEEATGFVAEALDLVDNYDPNE